LRSTCPGEGDISALPGSFAIGFGDVAIPLSDPGVGGRPARADVGESGRHFVRDHRIEVRVSDGVVALTGAVGTAEEKAKAARLALVMGTVGVDNRLAIAAENAGRPSPDWRLATEIRGSIARDLGSEGTGVVVTVTNGVATLWGAVPTRAADDAALDRARDTEGVLRVEDELRVSAP
jgi:hyperosmotically inducible periplasmic protein